MTPEEAYQIYCSSLVEKDDFIQECWLAALENPNEKSEILFKNVGNKMRKQVNAEVGVKANHIYNEDGECVDDNIYFVDKSTVEQYGEGRRVDEELIEKGKKLSKSVGVLMCLVRNCYKEGDSKFDVFNFNHFLRRECKCKRMIRRESVDYCKFYLQNHGRRYTTNYLDKCVKYKKKRVIENG